MNYRSSHDIWVNNMENSAFEANRYLKYRYPKIYEDLEMEPYVKHHHHHLQPSSALGKI